MIDRDRTDAPTGRSLRPLQIRQVSRGSAWRWRFVAGVLLMLAWSESGLAQTVWSTCRGRMVPRYHDLALSVAPALWFSPDEPLFGPGGNIEDTVIPARLPRSGASPEQHSRASTTSRVVYYRISAVRLRNRTQGGPVTIRSGRLPSSQDTGFDQVPLALVSSVRILYLMYYPEDVGFRGHPHDLEAVAITLTIKPVSAASGTCYTTRISQITGGAHGVDWYTNTLTIGESPHDGVILPPHILVEEGKHASAPDRNADGLFTPGIDVNRDVNDAWGVRDAMWASFMGLRTYDVDQAKGRCANPQIVFPRGSPHARDHKRAPGASCVQVRSPPVYELIEAGTDGSSSYCHTGQTGERPVELRILRELLEKWEFCDGISVKEPQRVGGWFADHLLSGPQGPGDIRHRDRISLGHVWHRPGGGEFGRGLYLVPYVGVRAPIIGGWAVPRLTYVYFSSTDAHFGAVDVMYSPSGSRLIDWYGAVGFESMSGTSENRLVQELGFKLRFPSLGFPLNSLVGARVGYRAQFFDSFAGGRWVFEGGIGGW